MDLCTQCGAELGIGRFCTNCGRPMSAPASIESSRTDTAERQRVAVPPPVPAVPEPARFPLYADEPALPAAEEPTALFAPVPVSDDEPPRHRGDDPRGGASWLPWVVGFVVLTLIAGFGMWLLFGGEEDLVSAEQAPSRSLGERSPGRDRSPEPDPEPSVAEDTPSDTAEPSDLASATSVDAPAPAPPSQDSSGNVVRYVATNMIDGVDETTWRMPGDGTAASITFTLDSPAVLTDIGLINGYAKVGQDSGGLLDWYAGNRRVFEVEWTFDDGTVVTQSLRESADMQTIELDDVETESVTLRLLEVSAPGTGRASRDYTAISEVSLVGAPTTR
ncbi:MAG: zinc ribbon domain-containing protein [Nocardioides sp.]